MNKRMKQKPVASAVAVAHAALLPVLCTYQDHTSSGTELGGNRSKVAVETLTTLRATSTDYAADCVLLLGDGKTKDGVKGTLADALNAKYGDKVIHVNVRAEVAKWRKVAQNIDVPAVREAASKGIRAMYDATRAPKTDKVETTDKVAPVYSQAMMVALVAEHFEDAVFAMRAYLLRAADSIGVNKIGELEVHLHSKTRKTQ